LGNTTVSTEVATMGWMDTTRISKQTTCYKSKERRNIGHLKIWKDQLHIEVLGTGTMPVFSEFMIMKWK
jgi:hypothetical protein